jgi:hypothetical protein
MTNWLYAAVPGGVLIYNMTNPNRPVQGGDLIPVQGQTLGLVKSQGRVLVFSAQEGRLNLSDVTFPAQIEHRVFHLQQGGEWLTPAQLRVFGNRPGMAYAYAVSETGRPYWVHFNLNDSKKLPRTPSRIEPIESAGLSSNDENESMAHAAVGSGRTLWYASFLGLFIFNGVMSLATGGVDFNLLSFIGLNAVLLLGIRTLGIPFFILGIHETSHYAVAWMLGAAPQYRLPSDLGQFFFGFSKKNLTVGVAIRTDRPAVQGLVGVASIVTTGFVLIGLGVAMAAGSSAFAVLPRSSRSWAPRSIP